MILILMNPYFSVLRNRPRRFYPGGDIVDYFRPVNGDGLNIQWDTVTDKDSLLSLLEGVNLTTLDG